MLHYGVLAAAGVDIDGFGVYLLEAVLDEAGCCAPTVTLFVAAFIAHE